MTVSIERNQTSQPIVYRDIVNAYTKGELYCVTFIREDGKQMVHKYPLSSIFRVVEDYNQDVPKGPQPGKVVPITTPTDKWSWKDEYAKEAARKEAERKAAQEKMQKDIERLIAKNPWMKNLFIGEKEFIDPTNKNYWTL